MVAGAGRPACRSFQPSLPMPLALELRVDPRVMGFAFAARRASRRCCSRCCRRCRRRASRWRRRCTAHATTDRRRAWLRQGLVASQVAMALLLLVAAGLFLRSLQEAATTERRLQRGGRRPAARRHADRRLSDRCRRHPRRRRADRTLPALPGVTAVGASRMVPLMSGGLGLGGLRAPGYSGPDGRDEVDADWDVGHAGLLRGAADSRHAGPSVHRAGSRGRAVCRDHQRSDGGASVAGPAIRSGSGCCSASAPATRGAPAGDRRRRAHRRSTASIGEAPRNFIYVPLAQQFMSAT